MGGDMRTLLAMLGAALLAMLPGAALADFTGPQKIVVLRVQAHDSTGTTYTSAQVQQEFDNITTLWGPHSSYGNIQPQFQVSALYTLPQNFTTYVDQTDHSSDAAFSKILADAVANAPAGLDWTNLRGVVIYLADTRPHGFHRGVTYPPVSITPPGASSSISVHPSLLTEDPQEGLPTGWGRIAHEVGHELQNGGPPHPSDYASSFEQMDGEYPAQTGVFERQETMGFPGWLPAGKYLQVHPPTGTAATIWAAENAPGGPARPAGGEGLSQLRRRYGLLSGQRPAPPARRRPRRRLDIEPDRLRHDRDTQRHPGLRRPHRTGSGRRRSQRPGLRPGCTAARTAGST